MGVSPFGMSLDCRLMVTDDMRVEVVHDALDHCSLVLSVAVSRFV